MQYGVQFGKGKKLYLEQQIMFGILFFSFSVLQ